MMSVSCATSTAHSTFEYLFQLMPSPLHTSQEESKDAVVSETLDLLVNFAHAFEEDGVTLDDTSGDGPVEGATPKAAPPLAPAMSKATATTVSAGSGITAASKFASQLPTAPPPDLGQSTRGRLVVDPNQMKKFLYGTSTSSPASSSSRPAANTVSWPILYFLLLFLYFFSVVGSICIDFFCIHFFQFLFASIGTHLHSFSSLAISEASNWEPPAGPPGGGWFRKVGGLIVAWKLGDVHRMRRLLQRWEAVPMMKQFTTSLHAHVQQHGWPKKIDGEYGLNS